jgi:hypothetical protein
MIMKNAIYQIKRFVFQILTFGQLLTLVDFFIKKKIFLTWGKIRK